MTTATVLSGGLTGGTMVENGVTYYLWGFTVNVDGQVYWSGIWAYGANANNPDSYNTVAAALVESLENDDPDQGAGGIADGAGTDDSSLGDFGVDDDSDSALASVDVGGFGDSA